MTDDETRHTPFVLATTSSQLPIDEKFFQQLCGAHDVISALLDIEDLFSVVVKAFHRFEEYLLREALQYEFYGRDWHRSISQDHQYFDDVRQSINVRIMTAFTAVRSYEDQTREDLKRLEGADTAACGIQKTLDAARYASSTYRLMSEIRNFAQHRGLPIKKFDFSNFREREEPSDPQTAWRLRGTLDPAFSRCALLRHFSSRPLERRGRRLKQVVEELESISVDELDAKALMRGYFDHFVKCHQKIRGRSVETLERAKRVIEQAHTCFVAAGGSNTALLHVVDAEAMPHQKRYISPVLIEKLDVLRRKHGSTRNHIRSYVSSELILYDDRYYGPEANDVWKISHR